MEKYILNYLREHADDELTAHYIELLKNELDMMLYGNNPSFSGRSRCIPSKYDIWKNDIKRNVKRFLKPSSVEYQDSSLKNVLSTIYFGTIDDFKKYGINLTSTVLLPLFFNIIDAKPLKEVRNTFLSLMRTGSYTGMLKREKLQRLEILKNDVADALIKSNIKAFFAHNDEEFSNKYMAEVCHLAGIPSFEFLHGLPGVYTPSINIRTDYLCVWGEKIKENYIKKGFDGDRIYVTGATRFSKYTKKPDSLRNSFDDILVAPSGACLWIQHGWIMDEHGDQNDSLLILYIYQVEQVLKQLGIKHARLRPHQTVDKEWVKKYIDTDFYTLDYESVNESLQRATMVIGPHSTLMMDALCNGVNYYVFDPGENGYTVRGAKIVPPFDGKDGYVKVAETEKELIDNIQNKVLLDPRFLDGYLQPFDLTPIMELF